MGCYVPIDDQDCSQPVNNNCSMNLEPESQVLILAELLGSSTTLTKQLF